MSDIPDMATMVVTEGKTWAVRPEFLNTLIGIQGYNVDRETIQALEARAAARGGSRSVQGNGVAVVPIHGVITPQLDLFSLLFGGGGSTVGGIRSGLRAAVADPDVRAVVLDIDSPGGQVDGIPELAGEILRARDQGKPIVAVANHTIGSAAYWLASQAHEIVASPSSEVGSIGVYQLHQDVSKAMQQAGVKPTLISAGKFKVEGNPYEPLSDEATKAAQQGVDDFYDMFVSAVAAGRSNGGQPVTTQEVKDGYGEGRTLTAKRAVAANLADRVATLPETIDRLGTGRSRIRRAALDFEAAEEFAMGRVTTPEKRTQLLKSLGELW